MKLIIVSLISLAFSGATMGLTVQEKNKNVVLAFYELAFNQHKPTEAAKKYIGSQYIQHNPHVPNGAEAFYGYFEGFFKEHQKSQAKIKRVIGDNDLVVLHVNSKRDESDRGRAVVDIFRVEGGKIVEHWDVGQEVPEKSANDNTMF
jgi:predicted SnoaL-like aldol condensation-catalyzing enzyme